MGRRVVWVLAAWLGLAAGCTTQHGTLLVASLQPPPGNPKLIQERVSGSDCVPAFLGFSRRAAPPALRRAVADALASVPEADALVDVEIRRDVLMTFIYNRTCVLVEGKAVSTR